MKVKVIKRCLLFLVMASLLVAVSGFLFRVRQKPLVASEVEAAIGIPYTVESIPMSNKRPGAKRQIKYIVIHNTANEESTAKNERDYLVNPNNTSSTSFNIVVDDQEMIEAIPVTEIAFHAGDSEGNQKGIGIELCESGDFEKTKANAAKLVAYLMKTYNISLSEVRTHHDFSGKDCPRKMLGNWEDFLESVKAAYETLE